MTVTSKTSKRSVAPRVRRARADSFRRNWHIYVVLVPLLVLWSVPLVMVVSLSLRPPSNPSTTFFGILPQAPSFQNYIQVWVENPILRHVLNSVLITVPTVMMVVLLGSMSAFALARLRVPLRGIVLGILIIALVLPVSGIVVSTYQILQAIGLYNNLLGLALVYTSLGLPFAVIVMRTAFLAVPEEIYDAARVDGAGTWTIFWRIFLPLGKSSTAVVVIWQSMMTWNDFLLPLVSISDNEWKPLTLVPMAYQRHLPDPAGRAVRRAGSDLGSDRRAVRRRAEAPRQRSSARPSSSDKGRSLEDARVEGSCRARDGRVRGNRRRGRASARH